MSLVVARPLGTGGAARLTTPRRPEAEQVVWDLPASPTEHHLSPTSDGPFASTHVQPIVYRLATDAPNAAPLGAAGRGATAGLRPPHGKAVAVAGPRSGAHVASSRAQPAHLTGRTLAGSWPAGADRQPSLQRQQVAVGTVGRTTPGGTAVSVPTVASRQNGAPRTRSIPTAGDVAVRLGLGTRAEDGSVVFPMPVDAPSPPSAGWAPAVQRQEDGRPAASPPVPPSVSVQAQDSGGGSAPSSAQSADTDAESGGSVGDLETLAVRLYPRISRQLRLELVRERDRLGALSDFRH